MIDSPTEKMVECYTKALVLYKQRKFEEAKAEFEKGLESRPNDGPCQLYIARCEEYIANPPPDDWDGVYTMTTK